jgi:hypothetical protein
VDSRRAPSLGPYTCQDMVAAGCCNSDIGELEDVRDGSRHRMNLYELSV